MKKAVIYCRVSSKEQENEGYSLPAQQKYLHDYAGRPELGLTLVKQQFQVSESASGKIKRKIFHQMMGYIRSHGIEAVIVETTDRLTRNFADVLTVDEWLMESPNNQIHLAKEGCVLHRDSKSHEWFMWRVKVATAEYYIKLLSENVRKGQKEKIAQGGYPTKPPLGYKTIGEAGRKVHVIDEQIAPFVRRMFEMYATRNYSITVLVETMHREGLRNRKGGKVGKSRMYDMLRDPFYYGAMRWIGTIFPANHEPLITKQIFDEVQKLLTRSLNMPQFNKHVPVFKAKLTCEACGGSVTWERQKGHWYGHCNGYMRAGMTTKCEQRHVFLRQDRLEKQLMPHFLKAAPQGPNVLAVINEALKGSHAEEIERVNARRSALNATVERCQRRLERLYVDKLDGRTDASTCERLTAQFTQERDEATEGLKRLNQGNKKYYEAGYAIHELAARAEAIYHGKKTTDDDRRLLLSYGFQNIVLNGHEIKPEYTPAFDFLATWVPKLNKISEPAKTVVNLGQEIDSALSHPVWLRG